jgi:hypothetical protein
MTKKSCGCRVNHFRIKDVEGKPYNINNLMQVTSIQFLVNVMYDRDVYVEQAGVISLLEAEGFHETSLFHLVDWMKRGTLYVDKYNRDTINLSPAG